MKDYFVPGLFLAGTLIFAYLFVVGPPQQEKAHSLTEKNFQGKTSNFEKLEQYRQEMRVKKDILQQRANLQKRRDRQELDPNYNKRNSFHETKLAEDLGPAAEDLNNGTFDEPMTIDQKMNSFLEKKQQYELLEQAQQRLYVETFLKEAYKMGYIVKVNENMEVVDVQRVDAQ